MSQDLPAELTNESIELEILNLNPKKFFIAKAGTSKRARTGEATLVFGTPQNFGSTLLIGGIPAKVGPVPTKSPPKPKETLEEKTKREKEKEKKKTEQEAKEKAWKEADSLKKISLQSLAATRKLVQKEQLQAEELKKKENEEKEAIKKDFPSISAMEWQVILTLKTFEEKIEYLKKRKRED